MINKLELLRKDISSLVEEGVCIAFSGGVDSSLILKIACEEGTKMDKKVNAITFESQLHPMSDLGVSKRVALEMGAVHTIIQINEFENEAILKNPVDRCYQCKKSLFVNLLDFAKKNNLKYVLDGTNDDDHNTYRPGIKALKELGVISPLAKLGITKEEVRAMAKELGISVASRPSAPCMATRLPYNTPLNIELLGRIDKGEDYIRELGFSVIRLRLHNDILRIEVNKEDLAKLLECSDKIINYLKKLGFRYITLDLEGFRSGSMDIYLDTNEKIS
ncbi:MAG: ATP-dependent sacrificial sulfur transferase LarE [Tissierellaceae bacterium]|nr:ATP-dependent sacrificial sulfur transferase LarE [Tissierellaceae bacterium]